jgi:hypothetical protein
LKLGFLNDPFFPMFGKKFVDELKSNIAALAQPVDEGDFEERAQFRDIIKAKFEQLRTKTVSDTNKDVIKRYRESPQFQALIAPPVAMPRRSIVNGIRARLTHSAPPAAATSTKTPAAKRRLSQWGLSGSSPAVVLARRSVMPNAGADAIRSGRVSPTDSGASSSNSTAEVKAARVAADEMAHTDSFDLQSEYSTLRRSDGGFRTHEKKMSDVI